MQDKKLSSEYGKAVVQEVVAQLPPGAVDAQRVQQVGSTWRQTHIDCRGIFGHAMQVNFLLSG